ncbi:MAG TPA: DUF5996 family protein [Candidatus Binatia bacterium]|jgi:hypothetical protein|nr:DUF5996 family protein [Candidatus Binatia bacterium]
MELFPPLPLAGWAESKETMHRFLQVVGKIRLALGVRRNHWWHVPFHVTGRGLTTRPMWSAGSDAIVTIDFDLVAHELLINHLDGRSVSIPLVGQSVASFHDRTHDALHSLGIEVPIPRDTPFDLPDSGRPFSSDTEHAVYDPVSVSTYWRVLSQVGLVLELFSARFSGKVSPVHHFWHTFDVAATRFADRWVDQPPEVDSVTREAYSREVISSGFWFGDAESGNPAFYSYTAPEPGGLAGQPLRPEEASWLESGSGHLAVLPYDAARADADPVAAVLDFFESAYQAGARLAGWDIAGLACPGGITDPVLRAATSTPSR